ncbi:sugar ABC transporter substrate-binding protein [Dactylosporangium fulvum]|uniref:Sugar ABC transporter substrate-binding protein n=1 Tax=Dactylosporangium fulvum TaxID=53359 RepID=A0ABY5W302_9ACTN|nr:sugar ABC transporter substrate-binding protein [Dactylosporangium fulvum]UWP84393.1 sugar ABC transporter substrate-binding protein [Dactylosporangium fulvum]
MRKKLAAVSAAVALLAGAAGCGGGTDKVNDGPVSLRMTIWSSNEAHLTLFKQIADAYRAEHPNVEAITFDSLPLESYTTTLTTQIAGGKAPDLAWIFENSAPDFVSSGALLPLDETLKKAEGYEYGDLAPAPLKLWQRDGHLYAYPFSNSPFGIFVNKDLVGQAGRESPAKLAADGKWDWTAALDTAAAVNAKTGKAGLVVRDWDYKAWDNLSTIWTGWGAQSWSEDGKTCGFDKPEMVEAMTVLHKAIFTDKALPGPGAGADFFTGEAGMTITQISRAALLKDAKFAWDLLPLPTGPKGSYAVIGQGGVGVLKRSPNAAVAADFLAFLTNPANSAKLAQFFPPPRTSLLNAGTLAKTNPLLTPEQLQRVVVDGIATGVVKPNHTGQAELSQAVRAALDPLWQPGADVPSVLGKVCQTITPLLGK